MLNRQHAEQPVFEPLQEGLRRLALEDNISGNPVCSALIVQDQVPGVTLEKIDCQQIPQQIIVKGFLCPLLAATLYQDKESGQIDGGQSLSEPDSGVGASPNQEPLELPRFENELSDGNYRWSQLLARDAIFPIYDPEFAPAAEAPYADDELVIGVALNGEAKAYAIGPLNGREMVNDTIGGVPILVTW